MSRSAAKAADDEFYAKHPEMAPGGKRKPLNPNDPKQAKLRQEWMNAYERNGGKVERVSGKDVRRAKVDASKKFTKDKKPSTVAVPCPTDDVLAKAPEVARLPPAAAQPLTASNSRKPNTPRQLVCELVTAKIACGHGRQPGPDGILMVVPDSIASLGDKITVSLGMSGGCGDHPAWSVGGVWTSRGTGTSTSFLAKTWLASARSFLTLATVSPQTYRIESNACGGGPRVYEIRAYPPGKASIKFDAKKLITDVREGLSFLPIDKEKLGKWMPDILQGEVRYETTWKEDKGSWRAFSEESVTGGFNPLIGLKRKDLLYGLKLPDLVQKYLKAGLYLNSTIGVNFNISSVWQYWPDSGKTIWQKKSCTGSVEGKFEIAWEMLLFKPEVVEVKIGGESSLSGEVFLEDETNLRLMLNFVFGGFIANFSIKTVVWIEINRSVPIFSKSEWPIKIFER